MNPRGIFLLVGALAAAGFTAFYAQSWVSAERAALLAAMPEEAPVTPAIKVLVAGRELKAGTFVKPAHMKWQSWPEDGVADGYVVAGEGNMNDFVGAVVRSTIANGQPLTNSRVVHAGDRGFLAAVLEPGSRAVSVPVNAASGIAGFVFPGDQVDLILTMRVMSKDAEGDNLPRFFSETLLSGIRVLAVDQKIESGDGAVEVAKTATLEVSPKQAEKVALALEMGGLSLSLHSLARKQQDQADTAGRKPRRSYTLDSEVSFAGLGGFDMRGVNVIRGAEAERETF